MGTRAGAAGGRAPPGWDGPVRVRPDDGPASAGGGGGMGGAAGCACTGPLSPGSRGPDGWGPPGAGAVGATGVGGGTNPVRSGWPNTQLALPTARHTDSTAKPPRTRVRFIAVSPRLEMGAARLERPAPGRGVRVRNREKAGLYRPRRAGQGQKQSSGRFAAAQAQPQERPQAGQDRKG